MAKRIDLGKIILEELYYKEKLTTVQIAKKLKVSFGCVQNNFKRYKLKCRGTRERHWKKEDVELHKQSKWHCWKCGKIKNINEFTPVKKYWMGHAHICKFCSTKRRKKWRLNNHWKNRAHNINRRAGVKFIGEEDLKKIWDKYNGRCYYCGKKLDYRNGYKGLHFDHVIPNIQKKENLVPTCFRCNTLKSDATLKDLERLIMGIKKHTGTEHEIAFV